MSAPRTMPEWFYKIDGNQTMGRLRRMSRQVAREFLKQNYPNLTTDEMGSVLSVIPEVQEPVAVPTAYDPHQKLFCAAAWICGASMPQLGQMFGITRQTVLDKLNRTIPRAERNALRMRVGLEPHVLESMREHYYRLISGNPQVFAGMSPYQVAVALDAMPVTTELDQDDDTLGLPDVDRRIG